MSLLFLTLSFDKGWEEQENEVSLKLSVAIMIFSVFLYFRDAGREFGV